MPADPRLFFEELPRASPSLIKGYSSRSDMCELITLFWDLALKLRVRVFIDRVSTDANPADWPSRNKLWIGEAAG